MSVRENTLFCVAVLAASCLIEVSACADAAHCRDDSDCCGSATCSGGSCKDPNAWVLGVIIGLSICGCLFVMSVAYRIYRCHVPAEEEATSNSNPSNEPFGPAETPRKPRRSTAMDHSGFDGVDGSGAPDKMFCPISLQLMRDPVRCACGTHTFERACLEAALADKAECPLSRVSMAEADITPDETLRREIDDYVAEWRRSHGVSEGDSSSSGDDAHLAISVVVGVPRAGEVSSDPPAPAGGVASGEQAPPAAAVAAEGMPLEVDVVVHSSPPHSGRSGVL